MIRKITKFFRNKKVGSFNFFDSNFIKTPAEPEH